jgi:hypothetical protein
MEYQWTINFKTREWAEIREYLKENHQEKLQKLANPKADEVETALLRGQILQINELLSLEDNEST